MVKESKQDLKTSEQEPTAKQQEFDIRLVPEYSGDGKVGEWLDKVALICQLRGVEDLTAVIPLRLCGDAFAVYQQLSEAEKRDEGKIRTALLKEGCHLFDTKRF